MMSSRSFSFDENQIGGLIARVYGAIRALVQTVPDRFRPSGKAPEDFATRPTVPTSEEYEAASNAEILARMYRNPAGLLNEQPFIDTLMNVRNAENNRRAIRHLILGFYILALVGIVSLFKGSPSASPSSQSIELKQSAEKPQENPVSLLKEEFNLKLQGKDMEIRELKRQINLLNQGQAELTKQIKSMAKTTTTAAKPPATPKPLTTIKPPADTKPSTAAKTQADIKPSTSAKSQAETKPSKPN